MSNKTLTRADLSEAVYNEIGLSRVESSEIVEAVLDEVSMALVAGEEVKLSSFGTFSVRQKNGRIGRNPKTGEEVPITPRRVLFISCKSCDEGPYKEAFKKFTSK